MLRTRVVIALATVFALAVSPLYAEESKDDRARKAKAALALASASMTCKECAPLPKTPATSPAKTERQKKAAAAMKTAPITAAPDYIYMPANGWHVHECPLCRSEWSHTDTAFNHPEEHRCPNPNCKGCSVNPTLRNTKIVPIGPSQDSADDEDEDGTEPIAYYPGDCPNGNCPTARYTPTIQRSVAIIRNYPVQTQKATTTTVVSQPVVTTRTVFVQRRAFATPVRNFFGRVWFARWR